MAPLLADTICWKSFWFKSLALRWFKGDKRGPSKNEQELEMGGWEYDVDHSEPDVDEYAK